MFRLAGVSLAFSLFAALLPVCAKDADNRDVDLAVRQFRGFYLSSSDGFRLKGTNEDSVQTDRAVTFARSLAESGKWTDIDYESPARSAWPPQNHLTRMTAMAAAAGGSHASEQERLLLLQALHKAFNFWILHDFQCKNWWYNEIGSPQAVGIIALLLGDQLLPSERAYASYKSLARYPIDRTGQNRVWLAGNALMRGLLMSDGSQITEASQAIWAQIQITTDEGLQPDFSFHQHGAQQQFGNYGLAFCVETARWGEILRGTRWALSPEKLGLFREYLLSGQNWVSWNGYMDISSCGRQLMPHCQRDKTQSVSLVMKKAALFDPDHSGDYLDFVSRNQGQTPNKLIGSRYFWRSEYLVHRQPTCAYTLKLSSTRVIGTEMVNQENLQGYHLADGALYLYRRGNEYEDIFPVWDWQKIPGVTCSQVRPPAFKTSSVESDFVGGLSAPNIAVGALDYHRSQERAKKAWFFQGDFVVCLGTAISGDGKNSEATTVNQCRLHGAVTLKAQGTKETLASGSRVVGNADVVEHDGWAYTFLEPARLNLFAGSASGTWKSIFNNPSASQAPSTEEIFKLWIDHGVGANGSQYAYVIGPSGTSPVGQIVSNSPDTQAVRFPDGTVAVVFWKAGTIQPFGDVRLSVDKPCVLALRDHNVYISDPTRRQPAIRIQWNNIERVIQLPSGGYAGSTIETRIPEENPAGLAAHG